MNKSEQMARVHGKDTVPELLVRKLLSSHGVRYRLHRNDLPGKPDLYVGRLRLAIFVNGCFWHGHDCARGSLPKSNVDFWTTKISRNVLRDKRTRDELADRRIAILELWTCQTTEFARKCMSVAMRYQRVLNDGS